MLLRQFGKHILCLIQSPKYQDAEPKILMTWLTWDQPLEVNINNSSGWPLASDGLFVVCLSFIPGWWWSVTRYKECWGLMYWWQTVYTDNQGRQTWRAEDRQEANKNQEQNWEFRETLKWNKLSLTRLECCRVIHSSIHRSEQKGIYIQ